MRLVRLLENIRRLRKGKNHLETAIVLYVH